jgi:5-methyltetrahydrofolate--homocysteine methyltransferase
VNVGLPDINEREMLTRTVCGLQAVTDLPLQIDTSDTAAMEAALRRYNGKAMVNSVNGKAESMAAVFPLVKKYGGVVVALTLDESGIPATVEGRFAIAQKIVETARTYGIEKNDIVFDTLAMTISADTGAACVTLGALEKIRRELGCHTSLGVSNVSFGLPCRDVVNSTFFAMGLERGLSAAIMNPYSADMMKTYYTYRALRGLDANCAKYVEAAAGFATAASPAATVATDVASKTPENYGSELQAAIIKGLKDKAAALTADLIAHVPPLDVVQNEIIPALNTVGKGFEQKTVYLPQLLMSAEAAKCAFECIKNAMSTTDTQTRSYGCIVLATVHGDIHDIGKNIVKLLLENYGFDVVDLGKDVPVQAVLEAVKKHRAPLVGLSALMTTTVPSMEETIAALHREAPFCKVMVGGAVLTQDYADKIGADKYASDAMEGVRYAQSIIE